MTWLVVAVAIALGAALVTLYFVRTTRPVPDYADPDVEDLPMEQFLDERGSDARPGP